MELSDVKDNLPTLGIVRICRQRSEEDNKIAKRLQQNEDTSAFINFSNTCRQKNDIVFSPLDITH